MSVTVDYFSKVQFPVSVDTAGQYGAQAYPNGLGLNRAFEYKSPTLSADGNPVLLEGSAINVQATVHVVASGGAQLQVTQSPLADVIAGTAVWINSGSAITGTDVLLTVPICSAFKLKVTSGQYIIAARSQ